MNKYMFFILLILIGSLYANTTAPNSFVSIARLKYNGGGDWYNDPSVIPDLLKYFYEQTKIKTVEKQYIVTLHDNELFDFPFLYITGHGNVLFSENEVENLRKYLENGGFLYADDDYGMDVSFRREMKKVFPDADFVELPPNYGIYSIFFDLKGLPKIHEHEPGRPVGLGIFLNNRLCVYYTFNTNISDGWGNEELHNDPEEKRILAFKMGVNILLWSLLQ